MGSGANVGATTVPNTTTTPVIGAIAGGADTVLDGTARPPTPRRPTGPAAARQAPTALGQL